MKYPNFIQKGDTIGIPAPSSGIDKKEKQQKFLNAKKRLENYDYNIVLSENIFKNKKGRSALAKKRAEEIIEMFKNDEINMLLCAAGGDFLIEILPFIDFEEIKKHPKWIAGFSDPTGILYPITTKCDIATIYGQNFGAFGMNDIHQSQEYFLEIIKGNLIEEKSFDLYENEEPLVITGLENYNLTEKVYWRTLDEKEVSINGRIIGGCFDILSELAGTKYDGIKEFNEKYKSDGIIWYFDNCEMSKEQTIRTLWKFAELDYFKYTKGIIFGRFGVETSYYDYNVKECLMDSILGKLDIPVIYDADISHKAPCLTIINGAMAKIEVRDGIGSILFTLK